MGRPHRPALGGYVYHVLNRANARLPICEEPEAELAALRKSVARGVPFGESSWQERMIGKLDPESTIRPRKPTNGS